ncbi:MAG: SLBB domain-containing protein [Candidatus Rokubacteria bacterium]|nr:SLBB domain-containing protein [Candidatus Rokubacteria bacterium]
MLVVSLLFPAVGAGQQASPAAPSPTPIPLPQAPGSALPASPPAPPPAVGTARISPGPDYRLGAGDLLEVQIAGRLEVTRQTLVIDLEGTINIQPVGTVEVSGLTLLEAQRRIAQRAREMLRFADVSLSIVTPRSFEVILSGEVAHPGAIVVSATRRLHEVILAAGGVTPRGSLRHVKVTRKGVESEVDLLSFELRGETAQNPFVEEGARIHVPPRTASVTLAGAFQRPGEYEIGPAGSLAEVLALTGGLSQYAVASEARLTRVGPDGRKTTFSVDLKTALAPPVDVRLEPGDLIFVPPTALLQDVVELRGAFNGTPESGKTTTAGKPTIVQRFELARGERILDLVQRAGGASPVADLRLAFVERGGATGPRQKIPLDLHRLLVEKDGAQNIALQNGDVLTLPVTEDKVYVVGEVKTPGPVDFRPDLTPREYVTLAGGPGVRAKLRNTTVTFRNGMTYAMAEAPPLEPGAVVTVPEVAVRWYQDYLAIATAIASVITAYTGLFIIFGGGLPGNTN